MTTVPIHAVLDYDADNEVIVAVVGEGEGRFEAEVPNDAFLPLYQVLLDAGVVEKRMQHDPFAVEVTVHRGREVEASLLHDRNTLDTITTRRHANNILDFFIYGAAADEDTAAWMAMNGYSENAIKTVLGSPLYSNEKRRKVSKPSHIENSILASYWVSTQATAMPWGEAINYSRERTRAEHRKDDFIEYVLADNTRPLIKYALASALSIISPWIDHSSVTIAEFTRAAIFYPDRIPALQHAHPAKRNSAETHSGKKKAESFLNRQKGWLDEIRRSGGGDDSLIWFAMLYKFDAAKIGERGTERRSALRGIILTCIKSGVTPEYLDQVLSVISRAPKLSAQDGEVVAESYHNGVDGDFVLAAITK